MRIGLGSDHAGLPLKNEIIKHLEKKGIQVNDEGTFTEASCDYPEYAEKVAISVLENQVDFGILVCGTGVGISIAANKIPGIRAALCGDTFSAHSCREHNNANILALGQRVVGVGLAIDIVDAFLSAKYEEGRHQRRVDKISTIEKKYK